MKKEFNIGIIGCGSISKVHLIAISAIEGLKVVGLCDIMPERAFAMKAEYAKDAEVFENYLEMMNSLSLDAVHICTPHYLHAPMAEEALRRGIYPLIEKPLCISPEQMASLLEAEATSSARGAVCFQNRFSPSVMRALELAEADGGAITGYINVMWDRDEKYYTESGWRGKMATEGGGVMINQAIHSLDLLCRFLGAPISVQAKTSNYHLEGIIDVEDTCDGIITHEGGKTSNFYTTTAARGMCSTVLYVLTANHKIEIRNHKLFVDDKPIDSGEVYTYVGKPCYGNGHTPLIRAFYSAIETGEEMPVTLKSATDALNIILAAFASHSKPHPINLA